MSGRPEWVYRDELALCHVQGERIIVSECNLWSLQGPISSISSKTQEGHRKGGYLLHH